MSKGIYLTDGFFDLEEIKVLQAKPDGHKMINTFIRLLSLAQHHGGVIRTDTEEHPDDLTLAAIVNTDVQTIRITLQCLNVMGNVTIKGPCS